MIAPGCMRMLLALPRGSCTQGSKQREVISIHGHRELMNCLFGVVHALSIALPTPASTLTEPDLQETCFWPLPWTYEPSNAQLQKIMVLANTLCCSTLRM